MDNTYLDRIFADAKSEIEYKMDKFRAEMDAGVSDPDNFISLAAIERKWAELKNETSKTYSDIVTAYLCNLDEKAVIQSKKENTQEKE